MLRDNHKRIKREKNMDNDIVTRAAKDDRISQFPDLLLHHILSLLLTKDAVVTSFLSKRWRSLWKSIPILDFGEPPDTPAPCAQVAKLFMDFVDRVLFNREDNSSLVRFRLYCDEYCDLSRVYTWLSVIIRKLKIQNLDLTFHESHHYFVFPSCLFTCESLTFLRLVNCDFKLPASIFLPKLKIMSLRDVTFSAEQLFSKSPLLEELYIRNCKWVNMNIIKISAPLLKKLLIHEQFDDNDVNDPPFFGIGNCEINIFTPNIINFSFSGDLPYNFFLCNFPTLVDAYIKVNAEDKYLEDDHATVSQLAMKFLEPLSNVQHLTIEREITLDIFHDENHFGHLPLFNNLISLTINWRHLHFSNKILLDLLQATPNLQHLTVRQATWVDNNNDCLALTTRVPQCLVHLKSIDVGEICGFQCELDILEFLVKNGRVLERLLIRGGSTLTLNTIIDCMKRLLDFMVYRKCRICFHPIRK